MHAKLPTGFSCAAGLCLAALTSPSAAQGYVERSAELGLDHTHLSGIDRMGDTLIFDWVQSGLAVGDLDGDGLLDVVGAGGLEWNTLLRNTGPGGFVTMDASAINAAEFDRVPALGDYDRDGDLDLFMGAMERSDSPTGGRSRVYRNEGGFSFADATPVLGEVGGGHTVNATWFDVTLDGWLDLYLSEFNGQPNLFYRNEVGRRLVEEGAQRGIDAGGSTHVSSFFDSDRDGIVDLFVGNDYQVTAAANLPNNNGDYHYQGLADGTFADVSAGSAYDVERGIMGIAVGDVNYDSLPDIYKTDAGHNFLMINRFWPVGLPWLEAQNQFGVQNAMFTTPEETGVAVGWSAFYLDVDHDPWFDLFLVNGHVSGEHASVAGNPDDQPNFLYVCAGPTESYAFDDETSAYGLLDAVDDRAALGADFDGDGDQDILVGPTAGPIRYFENQVEKGSRGYLVVEPICSASSPGARGVEVLRTDSEARPYLRILGADSLTASQGEDRAYFGLGSELTTDVQVSFPSGIVMTFDDVPANTHLQVTEPTLVELPKAVMSVAAPYGDGLKPSGAHPSAKDVQPRKFGGTFVVRAHAHDASGNPLDETAVVTIDVPAISPAGPVEHVSGNLFQRRFRKPFIPGRRQVVVSFDGFEPLIRPEVRFVGQASPPASRLEIAPDAVRAGSTDTYEVTVIPCDATGFPVGTGLEFQMGRTGEALVPMTDLGDGAYRAQFDAPPTPGLYTHEMVGPGWSGSGLLPVECGGLPSALQTVVYSEIPPTSESGENMASPHQMRLLVTARDELGLRCGPNVAVDVLTSPGPKTTPIVLRNDLPRGQRDGEILMALERPIESEQGDAVGDYEVVVEGVSVHTGTYRF